MSKLYETIKDKRDNSDMDLIKKKFKSIGMIMLLTLFVFHIEL